MRNKHTLRLSYARSAVSWSEMGLLGSDPFQTKKNHLFHNSETYRRCFQQNNFSHRTKSKFRSLCSCFMSVTLRLLSSSIFSMLACSLFLSPSSSRTLFCSFMNRPMSMAAFSIPISCGWVNMWTGNECHTTFCLLWPRCSVAGRRLTSTSWMESSVSPTSEVEMDG